MKRIYIVLAFALLLSASLTAQQRLAPPKVSTLPAACNVGDIVNLTTGTVGDYVCTAANTWGSLPLSGSISGADTRVLFFDGANTPAGNAALTFSKTNLSLLVSGTTAIGAGYANLMAVRDQSDTFGSQAVFGQSNYSGITDSDTDPYSVYDGGWFYASNTSGHELKHAHGIDIDDCGNSGLGSTILNCVGVHVFDITNGTNKYAIKTGAGLVSFGDDVAIATGKAIKTDTTTAHTALLQAYDNDTGPGYVTFATFTNGNSPSFVIAPPAGGATVTVTGRHVASGATPSVANVGANSCGTDAATIAGNDNTGIVTVGATSGTQCRITFTVAAATRWQCVVNNESTANLARTTYVDTTHVDLKGVFVAGDVLSYICMPR